MHRWLNRETIVGVALLAVAAFVYLYQLDSQHIPKNGDEYPYTHIVRETALSGRWLPLRDTVNLDNTKPPLLFWQGLVSTDWAEHWSMWRLRAPNVVYTLLVAVLVHRIASLLSASRRAGIFAAAAYLAFFSTYHYGRPFVTDAALTFWMVLPVALFVERGGFAAQPSWPRVVLAGLSLGVAALYKSPAFVVPGIAGLYLCCRWARPGQGSARLLLKLATMAALSLAVFSLWFLLDPNPKQVFESFVLRENLGKLDGRGAQSLGTEKDVKAIWGVLFGAFQNAGLLAPIVVALGLVAWRRRKESTAAERGLWATFGIAIVFFMLPSTRSGRYLLQAMPLLAVLVGLAWTRLPTLAFAGSAALMVAVQLALLHLGWNWEGVFGPEARLPVLFWVAAAAGLLLLPACLFARYAFKPAVLAWCFLLYVQFAGLLSPLSGPLGEFPLEAQRQLAGQRVWVPSNFIAKHERYRFLLPDSEPVAYAPKATPWTAKSEESKANRYLALLPRRDEPLPGGAKVLATRWDIATRHSSGEIKQIIFQKRLELLFQREYLLDLGEPR